MDASAGCPFDLFEQVDCGYICMTSWAYRLMPAPLAHACKLAECTHYN